MNLYQILNHKNNMIKSLPCKTNDLIIGQTNSGMSYSVKMKIIKLLSENPFKKDMTE